MTILTFYEKPGCSNNSKQKSLLVAAGHRVIARNLLTEAWTEKCLREFFSNRPIAEWFNRAAPKVKSGEIVPELTNAATALQLMLQEPLLIRRPLIETKERKEIGFDQQFIHAWLGPTPTNTDLENCPRSHHLAPCVATSETTR
jgi:nitrogenase-associated protein